MTGHRPIRLLFPWTALAATRATLGRIRCIPGDAIRDSFGRATARLEWNPLPPVKSRSKPAPTRRSRQGSSPLPCNPSQARAAAAAHPGTSPVSPQAAGHGTETLSLSAPWRGATDMKRQGLRPITRRSGTRDRKTGGQPCFRPTRARSRLARARVRRRRVFQMSECWGYPGTRYGRCQESGSRRRLVFEFDGRAVCGRRTAREEEP